MKTFLDKTANISQDELKHGKCSHSQEYFIRLKQIENISSLSTLKLHLRKNSYNTTYCNKDFSCLCIKYLTMN